MTLRLKKLFIFILFPLFVINFYQYSLDASINSIKNHLPLNEKTIHYVFENKVNLRKEAKTDSEAVYQALIGEPVQILEKTSVQQELYYINASWYKVEINKRTGYLWGGLLSTSEGKADFNNDGKDELFLCRTVSDRPFEYMAKYKHEYKLCRTGELIADSLTKEEIIWSDDFTLEKNLGFSPNTVLIKFNSSFGDGPAGAENQIYYYIKDNKLIFIFAVTNSFYYGDEQIEETFSMLKFPKDGNEKNMITIESFEQKSIQVNENNKKIISKKMNGRQKIKWNGKDFIRVE